MQAQFVHRYLEQTEAQIAAMDPKSLLRTSHHSDPVVVLSDSSDSRRNSSDSDGDVREVPRHAVTQHRSSKSKRRQHGVSDGSGDEEGPAGGNLNPAVPPHIARGFFGRPTPKESRRTYDTADSTKGVHNFEAMLKQVSRLHSLPSCVCVYVCACHACFPHALGLIIIFAVYVFPLR